jgi:hypothetical protein
MEAVLLKFDILNLSRYQLQIIISPSHSTVVPKLIMMWTIYNLLGFDILNLSRYQEQEQEEQ